MLGQETDGVIHRCVLQSIARIIRILLITPLLIAEWDPVLVDLGPVLVLVMDSFVPEPIHVRMLMAMRHLALLIVDHR